MVNMSVLLLGNNQNKIKMSKELTQEHLDYAKLANDSYGNHTDEICNYEGLPIGYYRLEQNTIDKSGYNAIAYRNDKTGEIIIVHRGTEPTWNGEMTKDLKADLDLAMGKTPKQLIDAEKFLKEISEKYNVPPNKIINTGHSLGGYLSNEIARKFEGKSVSFDPPGYVMPSKPKPIVVHEEVLMGAGHSLNGDPKIVKELKEAVKKREQEIKEWENNFKDRQNLKGDITSILAPVNIVNIVGNQPGFTIRLPGNYLIDHSIESIILRLDKKVNPIHRTCKAEYVPQETPFGQGHVATLEACKGLLSVCSK